MRGPGALAGRLDGAAAKSTDILLLWSLLTHRGRGFWSLGTEVNHEFVVGDQLGEYDLSQSDVVFGPGATRRSGAEPSSRGFRIWPESP